MIVKSDLAYGNAFFLFCVTLNFIKLVHLQPFKIFGVQSCREIDVIILFGKPGVKTSGLRVAAAAYNAYDSFLRQAFQKIISVRVKLRVIIMTVCVKYITIHIIYALI